VRDPDDEPIRAAAIAAEADLLVTGDKDLLDVADQVESLRIMTPRAFWETARLAPGSPTKTSHQHVGDGRKNSPDDATYLPLHTLNGLTVAMNVSIDLPDRDDLDVDERYAKEALVATLYSNGKLSGREAREILGMTRRAFEEMLPRYGFSVLVDSADNIDTELDA
jgi:predicted HTH domain antitoxin